MTSGQEFSAGGMPQPDHLETDWVDEIIQSAEATRQERMRQARIFRAFKELPEDAQLAALRAVGVDIDSILGEE